MWGSANREIGDWRLEITPNLQSLISNLLLLFIVLFLTGCNNVSPIVKIGLVGPFEGAQREIGYDVIYSARLAVRQVNEAGGIEGYRVALVALDDSGNPELAQQTAESLILDPAVVAVVGNWLPETTAVSLALYAEAKMPFLPMGVPPFGMADPTNLSATFQTAYEAVTPFDETPGPYAGSTYDAFQLLWLALEKVAETGEINRESVAKALVGLQYTGLTGTVYQPSGQ